MEEEFVMRFWCECGAKGEVRGDREEAIKARERFVEAHYARGHRMTSSEEVWEDKPTEA